MSGPSFTFDAGELCLDFANTWGSRQDPAADRLSSYPDLTAWAEQAGILGAGGFEALTREAERRPADAAAAFERARTLREAIFQTFAGIAGGADPRPADIDVLNRELASALPRLRLRPDDGCCRWEWSSPAGALDRMLWPVARSAAQLLTSDRLDRVRECASETCSWLFIDASRNRRRRWCDMASCGNRAKARRYYARHRGDGS